DAARQVAHFGGRGWPRRCEELEGEQDDERTERAGREVADERGGAPARSSRRRSLGAARTALGGAGRVRGGRFGGPGRIGRGGGFGLGCRSGLGGGGGRGRRRRVAARIDLG